MVLIVLPDSSLLAQAERSLVVFGDHTKAQPVAHSLPSCVCLLRIDRYTDREEDL